MCVQCAGAAERLTVSGQRHLVDVQKYQMSDMAAQPVCQSPAIVAELHRLDELHASIKLNRTLSLGMARLFEWNDFYFRVIKN